MTTKEIAEFFGKSSDTITRVAKKNGIIIANGKLKDFNKDETEILSRAFYKVVPAIIKTAIDNTFAMPKAQPLANAELATTVKANNQVEQLGVMVANLCMAVSEQMKMITAQNEKINAFINQSKPEIKALPAPKLTPRDELRMIINKASKVSGDYSGAWKTLYTEIYYRLHINAQERAKNAKTTAIDILDAEGLLESAVSIAREIFK